VGIFSYAAWDLAWGSQGVVVLIRTLAVWEVTRRLLSAHSGVWGLVSKILLAVGIAVSFACILLSRRGFYDRAMDADRGVELSLAIVIVCVFLFLRYYGLEAKVPDRQSALGFCLYSSFFVIDFSIFERYLQTRGNFWNFLDIMTFLATLFIWTKAARSYSIVAEAAGQPVMTEPEITKDSYTRGFEVIESKVNVVERTVESSLHLKG
jgi:hypothetical protein